MVDVAADEPFPVVIDGADVRGDTELDLRGGLTCVVVQPDQGTQMPQERVNDASGRHAGRDHEQDTVAPVFMKAVSPRDAPGLAEGSDEHSVQRLMQETADVIITVAAGEISDVHTGNDADLPLHGR